MYQGMMFSGCEESVTLESLRITITGVFCESRVGEGEALAMVIEESYEVGAVVETQHTALGVPALSFICEGKRESYLFCQRCVVIVGTNLGTRSSWIGENAPFGTR